MNIAKELIKAAMKIHEKIPAWAAGHDGVLTGFVCDLLSWFRGLGV